jgi:hypothetical protein
MPGRRPARKGSQRYYPSDLIDLITVEENGCWIWRGTIHKLGHPIYKGWKSARKIVFEKFCRRLEEGEMIKGRIATCHDTRCVCPWHQIIYSSKLYPQGIYRQGGRTMHENEKEGDSRKSDWIPPDQRRNESAKVDISDLEFLDRLADLGHGLMLESLPFPSAQNLIRYGYLRAVPFKEDQVKLELTAEGQLMVNTRKRMKSGKINGG